MFRPLLVFSLLGAVPLAAQQAVAFTNVTVIPMDRERTLADQTVIVRDGRIATIGPSSSTQVPNGVRAVDARGKFLMPGLAEMHAHVPGGNAPDEYMQRVLTLYLVNGLTTIRSMLGHPRHLELRAKAEKHEVFSPTVYTTGPSFNGQTAQTVEAGVRMVNEQKQAGYDLLKIHPGIPRVVYDSIAATAHRVGIPFAGHVPADVGVVRALEARQATIDHVDGYIEALVADDKRANAGQSVWFGINLVPMLDMSKLPGLVRQTVAARAWIVPTETIMESQCGSTTPAQMAAWPEFKYWPKNQVEQWTNAYNNLRTQASVTPQSCERFIAVRRQIMKALLDGGVKFLLGSDAPQVWNVPGFSTHREAEQMVAAGFTPYQVLESGTRNVAEYFGAANEFGTVAQGKRADLLLLDANPLQNIENTTRIAGVMIRGYWHDRADLDQKLAALVVQ
jgi:imidazolonepropionase-like amidohydrolase